MLCMDNWKNWYDWQRALVHWRYIGYSGLTMHALATICQRPPEQIMKEIFVKRAHCSGNICEEIEAPVFIIPFYNPAGAYIKFVKPVFYLSYHDNFKKRYRSGKTMMREETQRLLNKYPWPRYKGILGWKGTKSFASGNIDFRMLMLEEFRNVAKRNVSPWTG